MTVVIKNDKKAKKQKTKKKTKKKDKKTPKKQNKTEYPRSSAQVGDHQKRIWYSLRHQAEVSWRFGFKRELAAGRGDVKTRVEHYSHEDVSTDDNLQAPFWRWDATLWRRNQRTNTLEMPEKTRRIIQGLSLLSLSPRDMLFLFGSTELLYSLSFSKQLFKKCSSE